MKKILKLKPLFLLLLGAALLASLCFGGAGIESSNTASKNVHNQPWVKNQRASEEILKYFFNSCGISSNTSIETILKNSKRLNQTRSAPIYQIEINHTKYVLHTFEKSLPKEDREREILLYKRSSEANLSPKFIFAHPELLGYIVEFEEGGAPDYYNLKSPGEIQKLGKLLSQVHLLDKEGLKPSHGHYEKILSCMKALEDTQNASLKELIDELKAKASEIHQALSRGCCRQTVSHLDTFFFNLVKDGDSLKLIDWEKGALACPYHDIAMIATYQMWDQEQEDLFLEAYFDRPPSAHERHLFNVAKGLSLLFEIGGFLRYADHTQLENLDFSDLTSIHTLSLQETTKEFAAAGGIPNHIPKETIALGLIKDLRKYTESKTYKDSLRTLMLTKPCSMKVD